MFSVINFECINCSLLTAVFTHCGKLLSVCYSYCMEAMCFWCYKVRILVVRNVRKWCLRRVMTTLVCQIRNPSMMNLPLNFWKLTMKEINFRKAKCSVKILQNNKTCHNNYFIIWIGYTTLSALVNLSLKIPKSYCLQFNTHLQVTFLIKWMRVGLLKQMRHTLWKFLCPS